MLVITRECAFMCVHVCTCMCSCMHVCMRVRVCTCLAFFVQVLGTELSSPHDRMANTFLSELALWDNLFFMEVVLEGNCENFIASALTSMGFIRQYWHKVPTLIWGKRWTDLKISSYGDKVAMSVTHTRTHIFTLSMVRIKELFIFSLKKKNVISCFVSSDYVWNPGRVLKKCLPLFPGVPEWLSQPSLFPLLEIPQHACLWWVRGIVVTTW